MGRRAIVAIAGAVALAACQPATGQLGDACGDASECASALCLEGRCTIRCSDDCSCPSGDRCAAASDGLRVCALGGGTCGARGDAGRPPTGSDAGPPVRADAGPPPARDAGPPTPPPAACEPTIGATVGCGIALRCGADSCCDASYPFYCAATDLCYATEAAAGTACGGTTCTECVRACFGPHTRNGFCARPDAYYCGETVDVCCDAATPYFCEQTMRCYATAEAAGAACPDRRCDVCTPSLARCVAPTAPDSCGSTNYACEEGCCPPSHPFHCPSTDRCYDTEESASQACGGTACVRCQPPRPPPPASCDSSTCRGCIGGDGFWCCSYCEGGSTGYCETRCS